MFGMACDVAAWQPEHEAAPGGGADAARTGAAEVTISPIASEVRNVFTELKSSDGQQAWRRVGYAKMMS